jgi:hypothetical protein
MELHRIVARLRDREIACRSLPKPIDAARGLRRDMQMPDARRRMVDPWLRLLRREVEALVKKKQLEKRKAELTASLGW